MNRRHGASGGCKVRGDIIDCYRHDGFVYVPGALSPGETLEFRGEAEAVLGCEEKLIRGLSGSTVMECIAEVQIKSASMKRLAVHPVITRIAEQLAGVPLRLFKQELLRKQSGSLPTGAHTDEAAFPIGKSAVTLSAWVALVDVPMEGGCLSFVQGSHLLPSTPFREYRVADDPLERWPDSKWLPLVTVPMRAGDCTFHHARTIHMAEGNYSELVRVSTVTVYMDASAVYRPTGDLALDGPLEVEDLVSGMPLDGSRFPLVAEQS